MIANNRAGFNSSILPGGQAGFNTIAIGFGFPIRAPGTFDALWTKTGVELSTVINSATVQISGSGAIAVIGLTEYSINGGAFTAVAGTIDDGDTVQVRMTSSASYLTEVAGGVTIDAVACNFSVTTKAEPVESGFPYSFPINFE